MKRIIEKIEAMEMSMAGWLLTFWAVSVLRMVLESFSGNGLALYPFEAVFVHPPLFYACLLLTVSLILHLLTKESMQKIAKLVVIGFFAFLIPPFVDFIFSGGKGNIQIQYIFSPLPLLVRDFFTFLGPNLKSGATYGIRVEALTTIILVGIYIYIKTKKPWKVIAGGLIAYFVAFIYGALPGFVGAFSYLPKNPWVVTSVEILQRFLTARNIFAIQYPVTEIQKLFSIEMALLFLPIMTVQLLLFFWFWDKKKFIAFVRKFRYLRLFFHYGAFVAGIIIALHVYHVSFNPGAYELLTLFALFLAITCVWTFSLTTNDRNDVEVDKISNSDRLLITGVFTTKEYDALSGLAVVIALVSSWAVGYNFFVLILASLILSYLYSNYPTRLRRFPFVSSFLMSLGTAFIVLAGFLLFAPAQDFASFPINFFVLMIFVVALIINIKDIKDIEGDSKNGIYTVPTIFGDKRGKIIIALMFVLSYLLFPIILHSKALVVTAIIFSVFTWLLINVKKVNEMLVSVTYLLFLIVVAFTIFN